MFSTPRPPASAATASTCKRSKERADPTGRESSAASSATRTGSGKSRPGACAACAGIPCGLLSFLETKYYYGAKKHYLDWIGARELASGAYDFYHGWSGESVRSLREAKRRGIPGIIEIPTWHRNKGKDKPARLTKSERERAAARGRQGMLNRLLVPRQQQLEEYDLATLILVYSKCAEETFLAAGVPQEKLFSIPLATDIDRFTPGVAPAMFRAVYVGALIKRKGVHHLLEAWHRLNLKDAELVLVGSVHDEIRPYLQQFGGANVRIAGFRTKA